MKNDDLIAIIGNPDATHVGAHFLEAAQGMGLNVTMFDVRRAYDGPRWLKRANWWLAGRRPVRLSSFSSRVLRECSISRPKWVLTTGIAPLDRRTLEGLGRLGCNCYSYLTDDPWNSSHRAPWFLRALPLYNHVFSPRHANLDDLRRHGCREVSYLPFAYSPTVHHPANVIRESQAASQRADLFFAGAGDEDRVPYMAACIRAGFNVQLYGVYWERFPATRAHAGGLIEPTELREAVALAKVSLCLVRRANRDGHCMRTFEIPAIGACMLTEDTPEHRDLFGEDGKNVVYFRTPDEAVARLRWLIDHENERSRMALAAHRLVVNGKNTYRDRLETILANRG